MSYSLRFKESALKEWRQLDAPIRQQFKKKLIERLEHPRVARAALHGARDLYKIKLRAPGFRLVYQVDDGIVTVTVIAVGRRERNQVYATALARLER